MLMQNKINFMAKYGRGLICLSLDTVQAKKLNLNYMSPKMNLEIKQLLQYLLRQKKEYQQVYQLKIERQQ